MQTTMKNGLNKNNCKREKNKRSEKMTGNSEKNLLPHSQNQLPT